ncbi:hypothetical protein PGT21_026429 [Puccinia graminis f. sp. tritici]|uniref:Uncharacterized protein n=1 Tax=Puccinia graminis f. sp. tritici TaxID=56615 RepID=A0A5B0NHD7_PUCGR|nr:hypothetical protein PGT21_026429 [Puccinia graminis f. sp. tritici]
MGVFKKELKLLLERYEGEPAIRSLLGHKTTSDNTWYKWTNQNNPQIILFLVT